MIERMKCRDGSLWLRNPDTNRVWKVGAYVWPTAMDPKPRPAHYTPPPSLGAHLAVNLEKRKARKPRARDDKTGDLF